MWLLGYRNRGLGRRLVEYVMDISRTKYGCEGVYLHVWTSNTPALSFYKNLGFEIKTQVNGYYKKVDPPDAYIVEKMFNSKRE